MPLILLLLAVAWALQTCWGLETDSRWRAERAGQQFRLDLVRGENARLAQENARLQQALTGLARRPERAQALVVEGEVERHVLELVNADRVALGRKPLLWDEQLAFLARWRASDLHTRNFYGHTFPEGGNIQTLLTSYGGLNTLTGENLWSCGSWLQCAAPDLHRAFVESPGHKANQEDARYDHFGVGISVSPEGHTFVVELFSDQRLGYQAPQP